MIENVILTCVDPIIATIIVAATNTKIVWDAFHTYANKSQIRNFRLRDCLAQLTKKTFPITYYLHQVHSLCDQLVAKILTSLKLKILKPQSLVSDMLYFKSLPQEIGFQIAKGM